MAAAQVAPVSIGVELAGGANPSIVANSTFGGCTPGIPPASPADPAVPCPSYDPTSWVNDTASPLLVTPPVFTSGTGSARAGELLLASTVGGTSGIGTLSNGTCAGRVGSAFCTLPVVQLLVRGRCPRIRSDGLLGGHHGFRKGSAVRDPGYPGARWATHNSRPRVPVPACGSGLTNVTVGVSSGSG